MIIENVGNKGIRDIRQRVGWAWVETEVINSILSIDTEIQNIPMCTYIHMHILPSLFTAGQDSVTP